MKKLLMGCLLMPVFAWAQQGLSTPVPFGSYGFINGKSTYNRSDLPEEGTYLFPKQTTPANVTLKNGRFYSGIKTVLNLMDNEMIFEDSLGQWYTSIVPIKTIEFPVSSVVAAKTIFKTGFPAVDGFDENTFYEVLTEGSLTLLRANKVTYIDKTVLGRTADVRVYDTKQTLYAYDEKKGMKKIARNKADIQSLFSGNSKMTSYMDSHKINYKSDTDIAALFNFYNLP